MRYNDLKNQRNHHEALLRQYHNSVSALVSLYIANTYRSAYPKMARQAEREFLRNAKSCSNLYRSIAPQDYEERVNKEPDK